MANTCAAMGFASVFLIEPDPDDTAPTFDASSERYAILAEDLTADIKLQGRNRITGDRTTRSSFLRQASYVPKGNVIMQPSPLDLSLLLPRLLGKAAAGTSFGLGDTWIPFCILIHKENAIFRYRKCRVNYGVFQSASGEGGDSEEFVTLAMNIMAGSEEVFAHDNAVWPATLPSLGVTAAHMPYVHWEGVYKLGTIGSGTVTPYRKFGLVINNMLKPLFYSKQTADCFRTQGRSITLNTDNPFIATISATSRSMMTVPQGAELTFAPASGAAVSTVFEMPTTFSNWKTPNIKNKGEIPFELSIEATSDTKDAELVVANDSTA